MVSQAAPWAFDPCIRTYEKVGAMVDAERKRLELVVVQSKKEGSLNVFPIFI